MRRTTRPAPRGGFTLVELLVVIAIMALLAALIAGGIGQVRNAQMSAVTNQTLTKLQLALDMHWKAVAEDARDPKKVPGELVSYCDGDVDRARSLHVYARFRQEFPQTFAEAHPATGGFSINGYDYPAKRTFSAVAAGGPTKPEEQAAVLLYLILTEKSSKGATLAADAIQGSEGRIGNFAVVKDSWGTPITFTRFAEHPELNAAPYAPANAASKDSIDPLGKLSQNWANKGNAQNLFGVVFDGRNRTVTVVSAGSDRNADPNDDSQTWSPNWPPGNTSLLDRLFDGDNLIGYRLRQQGSKGD